MRILIACEYSGTVRDAFIRVGHDAMSCDLLPTDTPGPHYQGDVRDVINAGWDMMIAHPPCTYLTVTANKWMKDQPKRKSGALVGAERRYARDEAILFFMLFVNSDIPKIAIENPIGCMSSVFRKPDQIIQPFQFGHSERKATCLWLKGLPKLEPTNIVEPISYIAAGKKYSPTHYNSRRSLNRLDCLPPGEERSKLRSKTYQGIADAMAQQWGDLLI
jgi:hypothetical protein